MTSTATTPAYRHAKPGRSTQLFAGTGPLLRLALRRDRIVLLIWIVLLAVLPASTTSTFEQLYPTAAERAGLTAAMGTNPSIAVLYGPAFDLSTAGGFLAWRLSGFIAIFVGLMAIFTVTRHTRAEEDTGRGELLGSTVVGRYAMLTAGVLLAGGASVLIGLIQAGTLIAAGVPTAGSFAFGLSTAGAGLAFTSVAALCVQIVSYSRTANGISCAVLGATFLLRGVGNSTDDLCWLSWVSPIGWTQQIRPFAGERWWVLALPLACTLVVGLLGYALLPRRDVGMGIVATRPGRPTAAPSLRSSLALSTRLHRGSLIGWTIGMAVAGLLMGAIADGITDMIGDSAQTRQIFERMGGSTGMIEAFLAALVGMFGMVAGLYGVQATLRMRGEETAVRVEPALATRVGRLRWMAGHLAFSFLGTALIVLAAGCAMGLIHGLRAGDVGGVLGSVLAGAVAQLPAVWLIIGIATALFGVLPRWSVLGWAIIMVALLINLFGPIVQLPQVVLNASPFTHIPKIPGAELTATPLVWLTAMAAVAVAAGLAGFRRRDIG